VTYEEEPVEEEPIEEGLKRSNSARPPAETSGNGAEAETKPQPSTMHHLLTLAGHVNPKPNQGQIQTAASAIARGWTYNQLAAIATQARTMTEPGAYLDAALRSRANTNPGQTSTGQTEVKLRHNNPITSLQGDDWTALTGLPADLDAEYAARKPALAGHHG
jgi:hypothetical protein